ncbi:DsbA family protein [Bacteriovorax sp. DB6_IX]|uniref:DsbA family protein n=1 Tax=Bacteriovorax sp. DB6_IX TaxID=1353530 RepID=UPI000389E654|nr:DsbA family protein [Bacteriovorax sp. DB6_IX]EQC51642.1 DSBA-like thioredoxin domain protein [Bacteriovorax sp. DB6_IX]
MKISKRAFALTSITMGALVLIACTNKVNSKPNFIFKKAPSKNAIAKVSGTVLTEGEVFKGIESEIYEAEKKVFDLKMAKIKSTLLQKYIDTHPSKKGLSNDEFLSKFIAKDVKITDKEINEFAKERKIPQMNDELKKRIRAFLGETKKREAIENWLNQQMAKSPVEIYLPRPARPVFNVKVGDAPFVGGADAKVTIVEFSDFQCPYCSKAAEIVGQIKKKYGNKVKIAFKNFPLPFHTDAFKAAEAGLCANEQGQKYFWKLHDMMFAQQNNLKIDGLKEMAKKVGVDMKKFDSCLSSSKYAANVRATMEEGKNTGVKSTPTFFVNGQLINGAQPLEVFSEIIDEELAK